MVERSGDAPSGTVAFLFTDIEGSTRLWEEVPEAMQVSLERHDAIVFGTFERLGGYIFSSGGDGYGVSFARAGDALEAATTIQAELAAVEWGDAPIKVRMGLHVGEAEERNGDYFGQSVNRAARVGSAGHGGQLLATRAFVELVEPPTVVDLGEHRLRDLTAAQQVFQIGSGDFAALRTIDAYPSNLPRSLSALVGRDDQLSQILSDLDEHAVVTLTGSGGVGKTRLAVQACAEALPHYPGGAWFVDLSSLRDGEQVAPAIADVIGVRARPGEPLADTLRAALRDRRAIVLLDNGEHLIDAVADLIGELTSAALATRILLTSREPLGTDGEQVRRVQSLDVGSAVSLFVQRARGIRDDVNWAEHERELIEICDRLDGIPLAIELAAARSRSMLPGDILRRLDERFRLLSGSKRSARERHQTLLAAVEWSFDLLDDDEQQLFIRLAVFRGGFDLDAVEAVCPGGDVDEFDLIDLMDRLVDKSMVLSFGAHGSARFRLLETLRQFGESKLVQTGDAAEYRERHVVRYVEVVHTIALRLNSADQANAVRSLLLEVDNINAALDHLRDGDRWDEIAAFGHALLAAWSLVLQNDGRRWFLVLVEHIDSVSSDEIRLQSLGEAAFVLSNAGDFPKAKAVAELGLELAASVNAIPHFGSYYALGMVANSDGDFDEGIKRSRAALGDVSGRDAYRDLLSRSMLVSALIDQRAPDAQAELDAWVRSIASFDVPLLDVLGLATRGQLQSFESAGDAAELFGEAIERADGIAPHVVLMSSVYRAILRVDDAPADALVDARRATDVFLEYPISGSLQAGAVYVAGLVLLRSGQLDDAATLAGIGAGMLEAIGVRGNHRTRVVGERFFSELADAMDDAERSRHESFGRGLGQEEACRYAIACIDRELADRDGLLARLSQTE